MASTLKIDTILISVDGSQHARKAALIGGMLASKFEARVVLLHVLLRNVALEKISELADAHKVPKAVREKFKPVEQPVYDFGLTMPAGVIGPVVSTGLLCELGRQILEIDKAIIEGEGVRNIKLKLEDGNVAEKIIETAKNEEADFIVLGHRGLGAVNEILAGSVSTKVGHLSPSTVISVK